MKIAQISDLHMGYRAGTKVDPTTGRNLREEDGYKALHTVIDEINKSDTDLVLCTGDFFHTPSPSVDTIVTCLNEVKRLHIPFYCLAGNHDCEDNVHTIPSSALLDDEVRGFYSFTEPYKVVDVGENILLHLVSHHSFSKQKDTMEKVKPVPGKINVLCSHGSIYDPASAEILHSEQEPREVIIPQDVLSLPWDLILLGHIHTRGFIDKRTFYGGSLLRRGFADEEGDRGWTKWEIGEQSIRPILYNIPQRPQYDPVINCKDKSATTIEEEIKSTLTSLPLSICPIVRLTLDNIDRAVKTSVNMNQFSDFTNQCLTFTLRTSVTAEDHITQMKESKKAFSLLDSYHDFAHRKKLSKEVVGISDKYLKAALDQELEEEV